MFLLAPIPTEVLYAIGGLLVGFVLGVLTGWFMKSKLGINEQVGFSDKSENKRKLFVMVVNITIFILWTASIVNSIFQFNDATTPWFLHVMMGAVMGYLNENFGLWLLKFLGKSQDIKSSSITEDTTHTDAV